MTTGKYRVLVMNTAAVISLFFVVVVVVRQGFSVVLDPVPGWP